MIDILPILGVLGASLLLFGLLFIVKKKTSKLSRSYFMPRWSELQSLLISHTGARLAIIEADKLLDEALKRSGYKGATMGERLVSAQKAFSKADSVWTAHKLRNKLVHETDFRPSKKEIAHSLTAFKQALKDLGAL